MTIYECLERRRDLVRRFFRSKRTAVIAAGDPAEIVVWKMVFGKLLFEVEEARQLRWRFVLDDDSEVLSPGAMEAAGFPASRPILDLLKGQVAYFARCYEEDPRFVIGSLEDAFQELNQEDGCWEWIRVIERLARIRAGWSDAPITVQGVHQFLIFLRELTIGSVVKDGPAGELPPHVIIMVPRSLAVFARTLQPVPQPVPQLMRHKGLPRSVLGARIGPFECYHTIPNHPQFHSLDVSILIGERGVEFVPRCPCGPKATKQPCFFEHTALPF